MNAPNPPYAARPRPSIAGSRDAVAHEIDDFADSVARFLDGRASEPVFLENRLRHGVYGQRQDGVHMMRSKLPLGLLSPEQLDAFADLLDAYGHGVAHLTTRQDIQVHFIPLGASPEVMRVLASADMTSREACGNVVRNVCATPVAGVEPGEAFDVTAPGLAIARYLLRLPDGQNLGRKFKITLAGRPGGRHDLTAIHDVGLTAALRDGERGFRVVVGGGLGAVPHEARLFADFLPAAEVLPTLRAVLAVFAAHGEKHKRARARLKFLVADWGLDRFRDAVFAERSRVSSDTAPDALFADADTLWNDHPLHAPGGPLPAPRDPGDARWLRTAVHPQRQPGYVAVQVRVPSGDMKASQLRGLASLLRCAIGDTMRIGPDQSLWLRHVSTDHLLAVRDALVALGLGQPGAGGLADPVTCPGADTCKLGITTPRALAAHLAPTLDALAEDPRLEGLRLQASGCPNACAQHTLADIGLYGAARTVGGATAPHFVLLLGGQANGRSDTAPGDAFGMPVLKLPAARVPAAVIRLADAFRHGATPDEAFPAWVRRTGRAALKALLDDLAELPPYAEAPVLYREHGRGLLPFQVVRGVGECAGALVQHADLLLLDADRHADLATARLAAGAPPTDVRAAALAAFDAAARALLATLGTPPSAPEAVLAEFRAAFCATGRIFEGVGHYYLEAATEPPAAAAGDRLRRLAAEAALFVEEAHAIVGRLQNPAGARP